MLYSWSYLQNCSSFLLQTFNSYIRHWVAVFCHRTIYRSARLQVTYVWECWEPQEKRELSWKVCKATSCARECSEPQEKRELPWKVCKATSYAGECSEPQEKRELLWKVNHNVYFGLIVNTGLFCLPYLLHLQVCKTTHTLNERENRSMQQGRQRYTKQQYLHNDG